MINPCVALNEISPRKRNIKRFGWLQGHSGEKRNYGNDN